MKSNLFTLLDQYSDEQCLLLKEAIENKFKVVTQNGNQVSKSWGRSELIYIKSLTAIMDELFTDSSSGYFQDAEIFINKYMSNFQYKHNLGGIFNYLLDQRLLKVQFNKIQPIIEKPMDNFNQQTVGAGRIVTNFGGAVSLMAYRSGMVESFQARAVYSSDTFRYEFGLNEVLYHVPSGKGGELTHVYAVIKLKGGGHVIDVMTREEVERVRAFSKTSDSTPWKEHYAEMAIKSVIRRIAKRCPLSAELGHGGE